MVMGTTGSGCTLIIVCWTMTSLTQQRSFGTNKLPFGQYFIHATTLPASMWKAWSYLQKLFHGRLKTTQMIKISIFFLSHKYRESLKVTHGTSTGFVLAFSRQLGTVRLVNVEWNYDHEIDPLDPLKGCPVLLCSDAIYMKSLAIYSISPEIEAATLTTTRPAGRLPASTVSFPDVSVSVKKP